MSLSKEDHYWHKVYEHLNEEARDVVDAFDAVALELRLNGYDCSMTDAAEVLTAAITKYVVTSNPILKSSNKVN